MKILVVSLFILGCTGSQLKPEGPRYFNVKCDVDIERCYKKARELCQSPFEVRRTATLETGQLEAYVACQ